ncbi:MAG: GNAT family N-acetyltransferase [Candidatus Zixiibacteriota bacterium]
MDDFQAVSDLLCDCYRWMGEREGFSQANIDFLVTKRGSVETIERESAEQSYFVAQDGDIIVGMVSVLNNEITKLYVSPARHREGIGRMLFEYAERLIREAGYDSISLGALGQAPVPFYKSMGMKITATKLCKLGDETAREVFVMEMKL